MLETDELAQHYAARARAVFRALDKDGNGRLELAELPAAVRRTLDPADRDGDQAISVDEFIGHHNLRLLAHLRRADSNGDGALEPGEVGQLRWARLQAADVDRTAS